MTDISEKQLNPQDSTIHILCSYVTFNFNHVFRENEFIKILSKDIFILIFINELQGKVSSCEFLNTLYIQRNSSIQNISLKLLRNFVL